MLSINTVPGRIAPEPPSATSDRRPCLSCLDGRRLDPLIRWCAGTLTWAMTLIGFAGLSLAGWRAAASAPQALTREGAGSTRRRRGRPSSSWWSRSPQQQLGVMGDTTSLA